MAHASRGDSPRAASCPNRSWPPVAWLERPGRAARSRTLPHWWPAPLAVREGPAPEQFERVTAPALEGLESSRPRSCRPSISNSTVAGTTSASSATRSARPSRSSHSATTARRASARALILRLSGGDAGRAEEAGHEAAGRTVARPGIVGQRGRQAEPHRRERPHRHWADGACAPTGRCSAGTPRGRAALPGRQQDPRPPMT